MAIKPPMNGMTLARLETSESSEPAKHSEAASEDPRQDRHGDHAEENAVKSHREPADGRSEESPLSRMRARPPWAG
jgi:hypothetical protein